YLTGGISSSTTWNNQPSWSTKESSQNTAHRTGDGSCGAAKIGFNATGAVVQAASSGWGDLTLGLRAANEGDANRWKRFQKDATLQVDYNSIPTVGNRATSPTSTCVAGTTTPSPSAPSLNTTTPTLFAFANTADTAENDLKGNFSWQTWNGTAWVAGATGIDP